MTQLAASTMLSLIASVRDCDASAKLADSMVYDGHDPDKWSRVAHAADSRAQDGRDMIRKLIADAFPGVDVAEILRLCA